MTAKTYQPRWLAYCAAIGHDPDVFEGGKRGADFITWIDRNLRDWRKANDVHPEDRLSPADHDSFTAHLESLAADARHGDGEPAGAGGIEPPTASAVQSPGSAGFPPASCRSGHLHEEVGQ